MNSPIKRADEFERYVVSKISKILKKKSPINSFKHTELGVLLDIFTTYKDFLEAKRGNNK